MPNHDVLDVDLDGPSKRSNWRARVTVIIGLLALIGAAAAVLQMTDTNGTNDPDAIDQTPDDEEDTVLGEVVVEIQSAGRADGLDSLRMPMVASPNDGLVDGQQVALSAAGFQPNTTIATVQCAATPGSIGGESNCDVGNYTLHSSDENGEIKVRMTVRRYISTANGEVDCANPGEFQCVIAAANISDYDESATADVWFDPTVDGERGPIIEVSQLDGLHDGDIVTVSGTGFPPDAPVIVGQCIVGGSWSIYGCWDLDARLADVVADSQGSFSVEANVRRVANGNQDCFASLYGCRIAARADVTPFELGDGTATNPVRLWFDGTTQPDDLAYGVAYSLNPDRNLADGEVVTLAMSNLTILAECTEHELLDADGDVVEVWADCREVPLTDGTVTAMQCVDLAAGEEYCTDAVELEVADGTASGSVTVQRFFLRESGERVDCAEPGRICELRLGGDIAGYVPLRFAGD
ncbi:MAG: neocarzinostatin apoprotein domain-containing protein [Actinomycetota bacterium]